MPFLRTTVRFSVLLRKWDWVLTTQVCDCNVLFLTTGGIEVYGVETAFDGGFDGIAQT